MSKVKLVVIDDDQLLQQLLMDELNEDKFDVSSALTMKDARSVLSDAKNFNGPVVVLLDTSLSGTGGEEGDMILKNILPQKGEFKHGVYIYSTGSNGCTEFMQAQKLPWLDKIRREDFMNELYKIHQRITQGGNAEVRS